MTTATNPETGEVVILVGSEWKPVERTATNEKGEKAYLAAGQWITDKPQRFDPNISNVRYQASRFAEGVAGFGALPATAIEMARKTPPLTPFGLAARLIPESYIPSGEIVKERLGGFIGYDPTLKPPSRAAEIVGGASEFAGGSIVPSASIIRGAAQKIPAVAAEIGSTALGGMGSEIGGLPGAIIGSLIGMQMPIAFSKSGALAGGIVPWLRGKFSAQAPSELTASIQAHPEAAQNVAVARQTTENLARAGAGEFRPTLAGATGAPGIIAREQQIAGSSAQDLSKYAAHQAANQAVVDRAKEIFFPQGRSITRTAEDIRRGVAGNLESRLDQINARRMSIAERLPETSQQQAGVALSNLRDQAQNVARNVKNAKLDDVYRTADRLGVKEGMDDVLETVRRIGGADENIFQNMPPVFGRIVREYGKKMQEAAPKAGNISDYMARQAQQAEANVASFKEIHSLWREANTQYAAAMRSGDMQAMYYVAQVKNALQDKLARFEAGGFGELTDKFRDFNAFYATKYAPAFKEGVGGRMVASGRYGDILKPEDVVSKFFTPSGIDDFNMIYAGDRAAQNALADGVVGLFRQSALKGGKIDRTAAQNFIRSNGEALDKMPDIKAILSRAASANEALLEQGARMRQNISEFNKSAVARIARSENPDALIDNALTNERAMRQLVAVASRGGDSARLSLARSIADRIPEMARRERIDPFLFVVRHKDVLTPALESLGRGHMENLATITGAQAILGRTKVPGTVGVQQIEDVIEQITGSSPRTVWAQSANTAAGRQSPITAALHLLSRFGIRARENNIEALMREAIYNPEIASTWAKMAKGTPFTIKESNKFLDHLVSAGIRITGAEGE